MKTKLLLLLIMLVISPAIPADEPTPSPQEILNRIDQNMVFTSARLKMDMNLQIGRRTITKSLVSYSQGSERSFIEFLSPARDKGSKILKLDGIIRVYYPSAERVMRLSGHMLRQSMMGSDFSYEDMTERAQTLRQDYQAVIEGEDRFNGHPCYILTLTSKSENKTYYRRKIWVEKELFVGMKEELYSRSGKLLKMMTVDEIRRFDGRNYPVRITMEDKLRQDTKTEMIVSEIEFDLDIPDEIFSERNLMRN